MSLTPSGYRPRLLDSVIADHLEAFGGVQIDGPKWCGKTWTAMHHANSITTLDETATRITAEADHGTALIGEWPHLIDEWQTVPTIRDSVRHMIDRNANKPGQYILTGSSAPPESQYEHSGAGRIAHLRMRPMSLYEQGRSTGQVSLQGLFDGECPTVATVNSLTEIAEWTCRGGWPSTMDAPLRRALLTPRQYLQAVCEDNAPRLGKNSLLTRRIIMSLARNNTTAATITTITRDLYGDEKEAMKEPSRITTTSYIDMLEREYLIEELPCWDAPIKSRNRMRVKPKRYFADPSLAVAALGMTPARLVRDGQTFGDMFENLALRDLRIYASAWNGLEDARLFFYRDERGLEADAIIELSDGRWGAVEVKLGINKLNEATESLLKVRDKVIGANPMARIPDPSFLMMLVGHGERSFRTREGIYVVPLTLLGA